MTLADVQRLLDLFNVRGCWLGIYWPDGDYTQMGVQARVEIPRIATDGHACWVTFWSVGYQQGWQYVHTIKVVRWSSDDPSMELDLVDDRGRQFHLEAIEPYTEPDEAATWQQWLTYRESEADMVARTDAALRAEHEAFAENWPEE